MSKMTRRKLIGGGVGVAAGLVGATAATNWAGKCGLIPPDGRGAFGIGETLTYASHKLLRGKTLAREFRRDQISKKPFANGPGPRFKEYEAMRASGWKLTIDGLVAKPSVLTIDDLKAMPAASQITELACEEGWSFIAEWTGVPVHHLLNTLGLDGKAQYVVYRSLENGWWDSVDMEEALHPQTLIAYGMNGADLPVGHGGPLRFRVPGQLGYKSVKYLSNITVTDSLAKFGGGLGSGAPEAGYAWYAGI